MDYHRIYSEFIEDRKRRESALTGYVERHHILPRCMGGGDDISNLVRLTPEDHFFAHLVLAKAYESAPLWGAVRMMTGHIRRLPRHKMRGLKRKEMLAERHIYGAARRWGTVRMSGLGHPLADRKVYQFYHVDGAEFSGTRTALSKQFGVPLASVCSLFSANGGKTAYGWYRGDKFEKGWTGHDGSEIQRDKTVYRFRHFDGREIDADRWALADLAGVSVGNVGMLITHRIQVCAGWQLIDGRTTVTEDHLRRDGRFNARFDGTLYEFIHDDGRTMSATMGDAAAKFGGRASWTGVVQGKKTYRGWRLAGADLSRSTKGHTQRFVNQDGRTFQGTQAEFAQAFNLGEGVAHRIVRKQAVSLCGWRLESTPERPWYMGKDGSRPGPAGQRYWLTDGVRTLEGDRQTLASELGSTPAQLSAGLYAVRVGKMKSYKGFRLAA